MNYDRMEIIGSYNDPDLKFFSDVDLQEVVSHMTQKRFISSLKQKVRDIKKTEGVYFADFKMGTYRGIPMHFTQGEVISGVKTITLKKEPITLEELLLTKSIIKLDVIAFIDDEKRFLDFSINYYFHNEGIYTAPDRVTELREIYRSEYTKNINMKRYMKAIKRLYKLADIQKESKIKEKIRNFLNGPVGEVSTIVSTLRTLSDVISLSNFDSWREFRIEMEMLKKYYRGKDGKLSTVFHGLEDERNTSFIYEVLNRIITTLNSRVLEKSKKFIMNTSGISELLFSF